MSNFKFIYGLYEKLSDVSKCCRYVFGVTHIPRLEDWPVMPVERIGFMLMVFNSILTYFISIFSTSYEIQIKILWKQVITKTEYVPKLKFIFLIDKLKYILIIKFRHMSVGACFRSTCRTKCLPVW
jgi:hypothetical protein